MRILPVIDILDGGVVRGVAGRRSEYRPIQSRWTGSAEPETVAAALRHAFGFQRFYIADLDGILSRQPHLDLYRRLSGGGYELAIDAGVRTANDAAGILECGATEVVAGLETLASAGELSGMIERHTAARIVFSLDLRAGQPCVAPQADWRESTPFGIAAEAYDLGVRRMIVLDLADVGSDTGGSTATLCQELLSRFPDLHVIAGGGVRGPDDLARWSQAGIHELLIASALHDGRLTPDSSADPVGALLPE
jgi:phosphoribosylformimino-5-aminoimidazole carboxamide ribotide isomerase